MVLACIELLSLATYASDAWSAVLFFVIIGSAVAFCWRYPTAAPIILITELILGSKGYLAELHAGGAVISLRLGLFCAMIVVWLLRTSSRAWWSSRSSYERRFLLPAWALALAGVGYASLRGIFAGHPAAAVFLDMNGYLYLAALPLFLDGIVDFSGFTRAARWLVAALIVSSLKTMVTLYLFTHGGFYAPILTYVYKWIRDTGVGEITWAGGGFWRIFFQSHIYQLAALPVLGMILGYESARHGVRMLSQRHVRGIWLLVAMAATCVCISFSRSFWIGALASAGTLFVAYLALIRPVGAAVRAAALWIGAVIAGVAMLFAIAYFPLPKPEGAFGLDLLRDRFSMISGEAAVSSRWNLLRPLLERVGEHPVLGSGFGAEVTFQTEDPRIKNAENPDGWHTTYTFEWGYLDTLTEGGAILLISLVLFWVAIAGGLWMTMRAAGPGGAALAAGILGSVVALAAVHTFTPYLNHPLGIGILLFAAAAGRALYARSESLYASLFITMVHTR